MKNFFHLTSIIGTLPNTLTNGTTADATQVMADLNFIVNQVNANAAPLANTALTNVNNNFTVVQSGTAASAAANFPIASQVQNQAFNNLTSTLGTNTLVARCAALPLTAYAVGQIFTFIPSQTNNGSATLSIDSLGSGVIQRNGAQLIGAELKSGVSSLVEVTATTPVFNLLAPQQPGLVFLATAIASASATLDITKGIDSTFDEYELHYSGIQPGTNANQLIFRVSQDGGATFKATNEYAWTLNETDNSPANTPTGTVATSGIALSNGGSVSNSAANSVNGVIKFWNPASTTLSKVFRIESSHINAAASILHSITGMGAYNGDTGAFNAVRILFTSGTITIGSIKLYGVRKS